MPPKFKFTKETIIQAALDITCKSGLSALTARSLADKLGSSSKPIFGLFQNMEEVQQEVLLAANALYQTYLSEDMRSGIHPPYKASGMGYIRFAKEEKELFKLLFMRDRREEPMSETDPSIRPILDILKSNLGLTEEKALLFHTEMWIFVHGIATMIATSYLDWDMEFVSNALTDMYQGLKYRHCSE